jgi:hypothetical protein
LFGGLESADFVEKIPYKSGFFVGLVDDVGISVDDDER